MSDSSFFGVVVGSKKPTPVVPRPRTPQEPDEVLHISQVTIPATSSLPMDARVSLMVKVADEQPICVCTVMVGRADTVGVSVLLDEYAELSLIGHKGAEVHVSGYYAPKNGYGEEDDEDDENGLPLNGGRKALQEYLLGAMDDDEDDEDDEDEDDDDEDEDDDEENGIPGETRTAHTHIKELKEGEEEDDDDDDEEDDDEEDEEDGKEEKGNQQNKAGKHAHKSAQEDEDDEDEDDEEDEDDDDEEDEEEEEEREEMLKQVAEEFNKQQAAKKRKAEEAKAQEAAKKVKAEKKVFTNGFEIHSLKQGQPNGKQAKPGKRVVVKYRGTLQSTGKVFDQTQGNKTFSFRLGVGEVIKGWDKGVAGMRVGDKRKLVVPPSLAYGSTGVKGTIPPNSTLVFDVELVDVR